MFFSATALGQGQTEPRSRAFTAHPTFFHLRSRESTHKGTSQLGTTHPPTHPLFKRYHTSRIYRSTSPSYVDYLTAAKIYQYQVYSISSTSCCHPENRAVRSISKTRRTYYVVRSCAASTPRRHANTRKKQRLANTTARMHHRPRTNKTPSKYMTARSLLFVFITPCRRIAAGNTISLSQNHVFLSSQILLTKKMI